MKKITTLFVTAFTALLVTAQDFEMVKDINPTGDSHPRQFAESNNQLFFTAHDGSTRSLWKTDGSESGTVEVYEGIDPFTLTEYNGNLYFITPITHPISGLWKSDGTTAGTELLKEGGYIYIIEVYDNKLFFEVRGSSQRELWITDGTVGGTQMLKIVGTNGSQSSGIHGNSAVVYNDKLYFFYDDQQDGIHHFWVSDGTTAGTQIIQTFDATQYNNFHSNEGITQYNGKMYFNIMNSDDQWQLWQSDGTTDGTNFLKDVVADGMTVYNDKLYFNGREHDGNNTRSLWVSDGTASGTLILHSVVPLMSSPYQPAVEYDGELYFGVRDDFETSLWKTDGTTAGTQMATIIEPNNFPTNYGFDIRHLTKYNNKLYFKSERRETIDEWELWESDGTPAGTQKIQPAVSPNPNPLNNTYQILEFDGSLYFSANYDANGQELWKLSTENLSIEDVDAAHIGIYPNPVKDVLHIQTEQEITTLTLYSITGQRLQTWENQSNINLSAYANGMYLIKIKTQDGVVTKQVIKK